MEKVAPNSKFVGHSTEIIWQSKIKGPLNSLVWTRYSLFLNKSDSCHRLLPAAGELTGVAKVHLIYFCGFSSSKKFENIVTWEISDLDIVLFHSQI